MGKSLTLLPECRECTSACPNKPAERKMRREQTRTNEGCQNESTAAPGCERSAHCTRWRRVRDAGIGPGTACPRTLPSSQHREQSPREESEGWTDRAQSLWTQELGGGKAWAGLSPRGSQGWSKEGSAKRDVPSPRQPRSQEIHGISPSAASLCSELRQHE